MLLTFFVTSVFPVEVFNFHEELELAAPGSSSSSVMTSKSAQENFWEEEEEEEARCVGVVWVSFSANWKLKC